MVDKVGLAIIGSAGGIARQHLKGISELDSTELVGVCDVNTEVAQQQAQELGVKYFPTLEDVLGDPDVDGVTIATPHVFHPTIAIEAVQAGKHVLTAKPMAVTPSDAEAMTSAARAAGVKLGVNFPNRFKPAFRKMRSMIDEGAVGDIYRTVLVESLFRSQYYFDSTDWRGKWDKEGGGVLFNQCPHGLDVFQWLGGLPRVVHGIVRTQRHAIEVEDVGSAFVEYDGGALGTVYCSTVQAPIVFQLELWGERGGLVLRDNELTFHKLDLEVSLRAFSDSERSSAFASPQSHAEPIELEQGGDTHQEGIDDFARAILDDREPAVPGEEGIKQVELSTAMVLSSCRGRPVEIPVDRQAYDELLEELRARHSL